MKFSLILVFLNCSFLSFINAFQSDIIGNWFLNVNTGSAFQTDFKERDEMTISKQNADQFTGNWKTIDGRIQPLQFLEFDAKSKRMSFCRYDV